MSQSGKIVSRFPKRATETVAALPAIAGEVIKESNPWKLNKTPYTYENVVIATERGEEKRESDRYRMPLPDRIFYRIFGGVTRRLLGQRETSDTVKSVTGQPPPQQRKA
eukprot:GEZU01005897.1.p1 GENE.GEZU01005897.1~~GEZU01005897.1.p1  ORF type:complete len:109 (+),score=22.68 GEZU01005897.1:129-455(+)